MKRIFSVIAVSLIATTLLAGCNSTSSEASNSTPADTTSSVTSANAGEETITEAKVQASEYDKTFEGFISYMTDCEYIKGEGTELTASAIGAKQGKRYTLSSGTAKIYIELYEFDENPTSEIAKKTIENARKDGTFVLTDSLASATQNTLAAVSEDGRFLMLYTDTSTNENNIAIKNGAAESVKEFSK